VDVESDKLGWHREVLDVATAMHWYSDNQWMLPWDEIFRLGLQAARALHDSRAEAQMLNFHGWARAMRFRQLDYEGALATHRQALVVAVEVGDRCEQAWAHAYIGSMLMFLGRLEDALGHARQAQVLSEEFGFWTMQLPVRYRLGRVLHALGLRLPKMSSVLVRRRGGTR
jgi:hypothetical protein